MERFASELRALRDSAGSPGYRELARRAHYSVASLSQAASGNALPSLAVTLAYVRACGGDELAWRARWHEVTAEIVPGDDESPYLGLATFQLTDADRFLGREALVDELCRRVEEAPFVGVFGPSGSGKSSLLRAGLLAAFEYDAVLLTPGGRTDIPDGARLVVVDQFEEVFTLYADERERAEFINRVVDTAGARTRVVIGVRADFLGRCAHYPKLVAALRDQQLLVGPMTPEDLRTAIREPAARAGLSVEPALVERILADAGDEPGALPLISHALLETWKRRSGRTMTLAGYLRAGGVRGAIARTADRVYGELDPRSQQIARDVFLRLTAVGEGAEHTRRRVSRHELAGSTGVLARLAAARLVTMDAETVEVAHEALIRSWPTLQTWLADDREAVLAHRRLTESVVDWERHDRDEGLLYRGTRLAAWQDRPLDRLNDAERAFLAESRRAAEREQAVRRRRVRLALGGLTSATVLITVLAVVAMVMAARADDERALAVNRQLVADARALLPLDPELALLLAREAYRTAPNADTEAVLRQAVAGSHLRASLTLPADPGTTPPRAFIGIGFNRAADRLVTSGYNALRVWDWPRDHTARPRPRVLASTVTPLKPVFSPDGTGIAAATVQGVVWTPDWASDDYLTTLPGYTGPVLDVAFGPDGAWVVAACEDGAVRIWRTPRDEHPLVLPGDGPVLAVAVSHDGRLLASAGPDGTVSVRDLAAGGDPVVLAGHSGPIRSVAFAPDGRHLVTAGDGGDVRVWDPAGTAGATVLGNHDGGAVSAAYSADGRMIVTAGEGAVRVWLADRTATPVLLRGHHGAVSAAVFSPDGNGVLSGGADGTAKTWDIDEVRTEAVLGGEPGPTVFGPDGHQAATETDGGVRLRPVVGEGAPVTLPGDAEYLSRLAVSPGGRHVAAVDDRGDVLVWDTRKPGPPAKLNVTSWSVVGLAFSADGERLAGASRDGILWVWRTPGAGAAGERETLVGRRGPLREVAWGAGGRLAGSADDGTVQVWDLDRPTRPVVLPGRQGEITALVFSRDGSRVASGSVDGTIHIWNATGATGPVVLRDRLGPITSAAFSLDGRRLITVGRDTTVRIWPVDGEGEPLVLDGFGSPVRSVVALGDDRYVTAHSDGTVRIWRCDACGPVEDVLGNVDEHVTRDLTAAERRTYLGET